MKPVRILFVCLGNICRSPLAEGILRHLAETSGNADAFHIDSAGTGGWHIGDGPDSRSIAVASRYGIDISGQRCRKVSAADFKDFDLIFGMDRSNVANLEAMHPGNSHPGVHLFLDYATGDAHDVPDPYHEGPDGFEAVYRMLSTGCLSLIGKLEDRAS